MGRRLDIKVGFSCNNNCIFCAQSHKRNLGDRSTEELKREIEDARKDCDEIVFTGGEPTVRKDLIELVGFANNLGYKIIQIQSNGRMFSYLDFCKRIVDAGATEFSPALHGHTKELHEMQTRCDGSFEQIISGIRNLGSLNQYVITNTVITKFNYKHLEDIVRLLADLNVSQIQLAFVHPVGNAMKNFDVVVPKKSDVEPYVRKAVDLGIARSYDPGKMMIEAFPFCFMSGHESFCSEIFIPPAEVRDAKERIARFEEWRKTSGKIKFPQCKSCKYDLVCEGPWKEYPEKFGSSEFIPVPGKKVESFGDISGSRRVSLLDV